MNGLNQDILGFLNETLNPEQNYEEINEMKNQIINNIENLQPLCEIAASKIPEMNPSIRQAATIYIDQMISNILKNWSEISDDVKSQVFTTILELFKSGLDNNSFHTLVQSFIMLLGCEEAPWNDVIQVPFSLVETPELFMQGVWFSHIIISMMPPDLFTQQEETFIELGTRALNDQSNVDVRIHGASLIYEVVSKHRDLNDGEISQLPDQYELIAQVAENPPNISYNLCSFFWQEVIKPLSSFRVFSQEQIQAIASAIFQFVSSDSTAVEVKTTVLSSLIPSLDLLGDEIATVFSLEIQICASAIEQDQRIPDDLLTSIEDALIKYTHAEIYPHIQEVVQEKLQSGNEYEQMAALLIYRIVLLYAKDIAVQNIEPIIGFLTQAIESENELMIQTVLKIIIAFESQVTFQSYSMRLLPNVLRFCASEDHKIKKSAYKAAQTILNEVDSTVDGIFSTVMELASTLEDDNVEWIGFLQLLTYAIQLSDEIDDDQIDQLLELVEKILSEQSENDEVLVPLLQVGCALMKKDETQAETVIEMLSDLAQNTFQSENPHDVFEAENYLMNITIILGNNVSEMMNQYLEGLIQNATNIDGTELVRAGALEAQIVIFKKCQDKRETLQPILVQCITNSLENDLDYLLEASLKGIRKLNSFFDAQTQREFFDKTVHIIQTESDPENSEIIGDSFYTLRKLVKKPVQENRDYFVEQSVAVIQSIIEPAVPFLAGLPLIKSPGFGDIAQPFLQFVSEVLQYPVECVDAVTTYLLALITEEPDDSKVILDEIAGVFTEAIKNPHLSEEVRSNIFEVIPVFVQNANDPVTQQNLVFFLTSLIRANPSSCSQILEFLPTIEEWYAIGKENKFGYADTLANIASLYLEIAVIFPDIPDELIEKALAEYPPSDEEEALPMSTKILQLSSRISSTPELLGSLAMALARFFVMDDSTMEKYNIDPSTKGNLSQLLKNIVKSHQEVLSQLEAVYGNQRAKYKKLNELFA